MAFGAKRPSASSRKSAQPASKRAKAPEASSGGRMETPMRPDVRRAVHNDELLCHEDMDGDSPLEAARAKADLFCYEEMEKKKMPCKIIKLPSKKDEKQAKESETSPSPVDSASVSASSWWQKISDEPSGKSSQERAQRDPSSSSSVYDQIGSLYNTMGRRAAGALQGEGARRPSKLPSAAREMQVSEYPVDWSIKKSVKIQSKRQFDFSSIIPSASVEARAMLSFVREDAVDETEAHALYRSSLLQWRHPAEPLHPMLVSSFSKTVGRGSGGRGGGLSSAPDDWSKRRVHDWEDAFHSLYHMFRQQECGYFYYKGANFDVLFISGKGGRDDSPPVAYLTNSTSGLRRKLRAEEIDFVMPLAPTEKKESEEIERGKEEMRRIRRETDLNVRETGAGLAFTDGGQDALLRFEGVASVHGLYDFLLSREHDTDVPTLISPSPFLHGSLKPLTVKDTRSLQGGAGALPGSEVFTIEVEGCILPCALRRLLAALSRQQGTFTATMKTEARTVPFNVDPSSTLFVEDGGGKRVVYSARYMDDGTYMVATSTHG